MYQSGYQARKGASEPLTNQALNGGSFVVPEADYATFLNKYTNVLRTSDCPQYMVEKRTPIFKLFADLDFKATRALEVEDVAVVVKCIAQQVAELFECPVNSYVIVCTQPAREVAPGKWKTGVHLHWPHVNTDDTTAQRLRQLLAAKCQEEMTSLSQLLLNTWDDVVDYRVYASNGLRMILSRKGDVASFYTPAFIMSQDSFTITPVPDARADLRRWVFETSIRCRGNDTARTPTTSTLVELMPELTTSTSAGSNTCPEALHEHAEGLADLKTALTALYPEYEAMRWCALARGDRCFLLRCSSKYCQNLVAAGHKPDALGEHTSNHVYFVITPTCVYQKCFSTTETTEKRRFGMCKDFRGPSIPVPDALRVSLFGELPAPARVPSVEAVRSKDVCTLQYNRSMEDLLESLRPLAPKKRKTKRRK
jgi:hypothetical protein